MTIRLIDVYADPSAPELLYRLLAERPPEANISHKTMPSRAEHMAFYLRKPYRNWWLIQVTEFGERNADNSPNSVETLNVTVVGACYVTERNEIGIAIFEKYRRRGYAVAAIRQMIGMMTDKTLADRRLTYYAN